MTRCLKTAAIALTLSALIPISACAPESTEPQELVFTIAHEDMHCAVNEKKQQVLNSAQEINAAFGTPAALKTQIGAAPATAPDKLREALASADFSKQTWILVAWGSLPNPGHHPVAVETQARFANGTLQLPLRVQTPEAGKLYPQVIVTPCQLIKIAQRLPVERIEVQ